MDENAAAPSGVYRKVWTRRAIVLSIVITAFLASAIGVGVFLLIK
jgi:hypothetical protein